MHKSMAIKAIWFTACLIALWLAYNVRGLHDADLVFLYLTLALTFPVGLLVQGAIVFSVYLFDVSYPGSFSGNLIFWAIAVGLGYWQWFVAWPWLFRRIRAGRN